MKFVPDSMKEEKPEVVVVREGNTVRSFLRYPPQKPSERDEAEYDPNDEQYREDI